MNFDIIFLRRNVYSPTAACFTRYTKAKFVQISSGSDIYSIAIQEAKFLKNKNLIAPRFISPKAIKLRPNMTRWSNLIWYIPNLIQDNQAATTTKNQKIVVESKFILSEKMRIENRIRQKLNLIWCIAAVFLMFFGFILEIAEDARSAAVSSVSQVSNMGFGLVTQGTSGGTILTRTSCTGTGTAKKIGTSGAFPCANGSFLVNGINNTTGTNRNRVTVNIPAVVTVSNGTASMNVALSLSTTSAVTRRNVNLSGVSGGAGTVSVPVYGTLTIVTTQSTGNYAGNYTFFACNDSLTAC